MSNKVRLISTISAICMVLALLTVGVWAVSTASVTLGGSVSFTADNVHARITGSVTGTQETISLPNLEYDVNTDVNSTDFQSKLSSWANNDMTFTSENLITMTITVENLSEERSLFVTLTDITTTDNVGKTLKQGANEYTSGSAVEVTAGNTTTLTMTLSVTDKNQSASATVAYQVDLRDANAEEPIELLHDTENDYYYVEMGTYGENDEAVRWRVVGVEGEHYEYNENQAPSGELTFILETYIGALHAFGSYDGNEKGNNDYSTSYVREYLTGIDSYALDYNGENDNTDNGSFLEDFNILETDAIYSLITPRSMEDLYKDINWYFNTSTMLEGTPKNTTGSDKLWLASTAEIFSILAGGDISTAQWDSSMASKLAWNMMFYWLRSPYLENSHYIRDINFDGGFGGDSIHDNYAVRPMFILEV